MSELKRFKPDYKSLGIAFGSECDDGEYVLFTDYDQLRQQLEAAQADVEKYKFHAAENEQKWIGAADKVIRLQSIIKKAQEQEYVAEIMPNWSIHWKGSEPIAYIIDRCGVKAGDRLYALPPIPAEHGEDIVENIAKYVEMQKGGPFTSDVMAAAIRGFQQYGEGFKSEVKPSEEKQYACYCGKVMAPKRNHCCSDPDCIPY